MTRRTNKPKKSFKNTVLCFCEGETEKEYLTCLKKDKYANLHIELKPLISNTGFENIFNEIEQKLAEPSETNYKYIFYVLDLDVIYNKHQEGKYNERKKKVEFMAKAKERWTIPFFLSALFGFNFSRKLFYIFTFSLQTKQFVYFNSNVFSFNLYFIQVVGINHVFNFFIGELTDNYMIEGIIFFV